MDTLDQATQLEFADSLSVDLPAPVSESGGVGSWEVTDEIDLLDVINEVYCPAVIKQRVLIGTDENGQNILKYNVKYVGWDDVWNEWITDTSRMVVKGTHVHIHRGWVKYCDKTGYWPSLVYIRTPMPGSVKGRDYLKQEVRLFVTPCGPIAPHASPLRPYKHGVWIAAHRISSLKTGKKQRIEKGLNGRYRDCFQLAMEEIALYTAVQAEDFLLEGSYDVQEEVRIQQAQMELQAAAEKSQKDTKRSVRSGRPRHSLQEDDVAPMASYDVSDITRLLAEKRTRIRYDPGSVDGSHEFVNLNSLAAHVVQSTYLPDIQTTAARKIIELGFAWCPQTRIEADNRDQHSTAVPDSLSNTRGVVNLVSPGSGCSAVAVARLRGSAECPQELTYSIDNLWRITDHFSPTVNMILSLAHTHIPASAGSRNSCSANVPAGCEKTGLVPLPLQHRSRKQLKPKPFKSRRSKERGWGLP
jgi:hypothetical protein